MPDDKQSTLVRLLERGMVQIHVDPRREGVVLPGHLTDQPAVAINLSRRFPGALVVGEEGVCAELQFDSVPFSVVLPWACIFAMASQVGAGAMAWPADIPEEIAAGTVEIDDKPAPPKLRLVH